MLLILCTGELLRYAMGYPSSHALELGASREQKLEDYKIMKQIKYALMAAICLMLPSQVNAGENGYIQASASFANIGDASAPYRGTAGTTYSLDEDLAIGASGGWNLHKNFAIEFKLNYLEGSVDNIGGVKARDGSQYNYGVATIGLNYNHDPISFDKSGQFSITPYVGAGVGYDAGYLDAQKDTENNCGTGTDTSANGACASGDNRNDHGSAMRLGVGGLVELHKNIGLDLNYDYVWGTVDTHMANVGIRVMF